MRNPFSRGEKRELTEVQWERLFERKTTKAGASVTADSAVYSSVVAACLLVRAEAKATLPVQLYRQNGELKEKAADRPEYELLKSAWNPTLTAAQGWLWQQITTDLMGNAYALRETRGSQTVGLYPLVGETVPIIETVKGTPRVKGYKHRENSGAEWEPLTVKEVVHFPSAFISSDGVTGRSLVDMARESIGLDISAEEFMGRLLSNGTHFGIVLSTDQPLTADDVAAVTDQLKDGKGVAPAGKARVFTKGIKPQMVGSTVKDAEMIEQRRYQVERICGVFKVPLTKAQAMWFGTYSNSEQSDLDFTKGCVVPMCVATEQVLNARLFSGQDLYVKFDVRGLLRGDFATRMQGLASGVNGGILTPNEARAWEDLDPLPGGDELRFPLNSVPASEMESDDEAPQEAPVELVPQAASRREKSKNRLQLQRSMRGVFVDAARRIVRREVQDVMREARKMMGTRTVEDFRLWLRDYYRTFPDFYKQQLEPVVRSYGEAIADLASAEADGTYDSRALDEFVAGYVGTSSKRYMSSHQGQLEKLLADETDKLAAIEERLNGWEDTTPDKIGMRESVEAAGAFAKWAFIAAGVERLMWVNTSDKSCPWCEQLDGQVVGVEYSFADAGEMDVNGASLAVSNDTFHPPLHAGCECVIVPG